jgi:hypothetical protein
MCSWTAAWARTDLKFNVDADDLSLLDPMARGTISARALCRAEGQRVLQLKAKGAGFEWHGTSLDSLNADIDIEPAAPAAPKVRSTSLVCGLAAAGWTRRRSGCGNQRHAERRRERGRGAIAPGADRAGIDAR